MIWQTNIFLAKIFDVLINTILLLKFKCSETIQIPTNARDSQMYLKKNTLSASCKSYIFDFSKSTLKQKNQKENLFTYL